MIGSMIHICIVEDEQSLAEMIQLNLELEGYQTTVYRDGEVARNMLESEHAFDLIILDVMLPGVSGIELCKHLRTYSDVPILFLSAKGTTTDRIEGLKAGANDYLPKPFDLEELLLRVGILANVQPQLDHVQIGDKSVNFKTYEVLDSEMTLIKRISKREVDLIQLFVQQEGEVVSRSEILDKVWGKDQFPTSRTIDNYILSFRKLFEEDAKNPVYFHSIRGVGYKFTK